MVAGPMERMPDASAASDEHMMAAIQSVNADLSLPALYGAIADAGATLAGASSAAVFAYEGSALRCVAVRGEARLAEPQQAYLPVPPQWPPLRQMQASAHAVSIADTATEPQWSAFEPSRPAGHRICSWLGVPLAVNGRLLGFLDVAFEERTAISSDRSKVLQSFAEHAAYSLRNALLLAESAAQARNAGIRAAVQIHLSSIMEPAAALQAAVEELGQALEVSRCAISVVQPGIIRRAAALYEEEGVALDRHADAALQPLLALTIQQQRPIVVADIAGQDDGETTVLAGRESLLAHEIRSVLSIPLVHNSQSLGVLTLLQLGRGRTWRPGEVALAESIASDVANALVQARARQEREREAAAIRGERDHLRTIVDHLPLGVVVAETPDEIVFWNRAAAAMAAKRAGTQDAARGGAPQFELFRDGAPYPADEAPLPRAYHEDRPVSGEILEMRHQDGYLVPTAVTALPLHDARGQVAGAFAILHDISAQRQIERQAQRAARQLSMLQSVVVRISSGVAFEDLLAELGEQIAEVLPFDLLTVSTAETPRAQVQRVGTAGQLGQGSRQPDAAVIEQDVVRRVMESTRPLLIDDVTGEEAEDDNHLLSEAGIFSSLVVPVQVGERIIGALSLLSCRPGAYAADDLAVATPLAQLLGLALRWEEQAQQARESATREERERLAREIHDTLAQTITGVVMQLDSAVTAAPTDSTLRGRLEQARSMAREALTETRRSVWNLRPPNVNLQMPRTVLQEEAALLQRRMKINPEVITSGEERQVAPEVGAVLQRLVRVSLENTWMHSEARQVRILLDYGLQSLTLLIEDDGRGFDPDTVDLQGEGRVGLAGVAERLRSIGGSIRLESAANQGTRVQAELPYVPIPPEQIPQPRVAEPAAPSRVQPAPGEGIRVLLIDDHAMVREGLERMLQDQADLHVIASAATGAEGLRRIAELQPDVVLCDLQLPDMSGVEVISRVRTHFPDIRCLVVTTFDDDESIYEGFKAGAKGYVLKDVSAHELAEAVRAAARGESLLQPIVARKLVEGFGELARQGGVVEALTEREVEVLKALAGGARNKEIAFDLGLSESTIKTHLASIFGKLNVTTRTEAVARGRELGLLSL